MAQCSATPAIVAATPPCSATPFQTTKFRCDTSRHRGGGGATPNFLGGVARHRCYTCKTLFKIQEISCDTCSATGGTRNRVQLRVWLAKIGLSGLGAPLFWDVRVAYKRELFARPQKCLCSCFANPFSPYSIQERPEPPICPTFVPAIVFGGSSQGGWNVSKIFQNLSAKLPFFKFWQILDKFQSPRLEPPENNRSNKFWRIWGSGCFWMGHPTAICDSIAAIPPYSAL